MPTGVYSRKKRMNNNDDSDELHDLREIVKQYEAELKVKNVLEADLEDEREKLANKTAEYQKLAIKYGALEDLIMDMVKS